MAVCERGAVKPLQQQQRAVESMAWPPTKRSSCVHARDTCQATLGCIPPMDRAATCHHPLHFALNRVGVLGGDFRPLHVPKLCLRCMERPQTTTSSCSYAKGMSHASGQRYITLSRPGARKPSLLAPTSGVVLGQVGGSDMVTPRATHSCGWLCALTSRAICLGHVPCRSSTPADQVKAKHKAVSWTMPPCPTWCFSCRHWAHSAGLLAVRAAKSCCCRGLVSEVPSTWSTCSHVPQPASRSEQPSSPRNPRGGVGWWGCWQCMGASAKMQ